MHTSTYTLDHNKLSDAICILSGEIEAISPLVQTQREMMPRIKRVTYTVFLGLAAIVALGNHGWISWTSEWVAATILYVAYMVLGWFLGRGELRAWSQMRKAEERLGLPRTKRFSFVGWKEVKARLPLLLSHVLSVFLIVFLVFLNMTALIDLWIFDVGLMLTAGIQAVTWKTILFRNTLIHSRRLEDTEHLRTRLQQELERQRLLESGAEQEFSLSGEEYKKIARMERALISLDRERAIKERARNSDQPGPAVQQSPEVLRKKTMLAPEVRLRVQTQIDKLSTQPQPQAATEVNGTWHLPVPQSSLEIRYVLNPNVRQVMVNDIVDTRTLRI